MKYRLQILSRLQIWYRADVHHWLPTMSYWKRMSFRTNRIWREKYLLLLWHWKLAILRNYLLLRNSNSSKINWKIQMEYIFHPNDMVVQNRFRQRCCHVLTYWKYIDLLRCIAKLFQFAGVIFSMNILKNNCDFPFF